MTAVGEVVGANSEEFGNSGGFRVRLDVSLSTTLADVRGWTGLVAASPRRVAHTKLWVPHTSAACVGLEAGGCLVGGGDPDCESEQLQAETNNDKRK
jgi:hypothetical protein